MIRGYKDLNELYALTELFKTRTNLSFDSTDEKKLGQRIKSYIFGKKGTSIYDSLDSKDKYWIDNFKYYNEILDSLQRLYQAYAYICKFPRYKYYNFFKINEFLWIRYHIEFWLQEVYILRLRTISWLNYLTDKAKHKSNIDAIAYLNKSRKITNKVFKGLKIVRGMHVHEQRFEPGDFTGIDFLNLLISKGKVKKLIPLRNFRLGLLLLNWKAKMIENNESLVKMYSAMFGSFRYLLVDLE